MIRFIERRVTVSNAASICYCCAAEKRDELAPPQVEILKRVGYSTRDAGHPPPLTKKD
jgi:hypothetical protein